MNRLAMFFVVLSFAVTPCLGQVSSPNPMPPVEEPPVGETVCFSYGSLVECLPSNLVINACGAVANNCPGTYTQNTGESIVSLNGPFNLPVPNMGGPYYEADVLSWIFCLKDAKCLVVNVNGVNQCQPDLNTITESDRHDGGWLNYDLPCILD